MIRFSILACLAILLLLVPPGTASDGSPETTVPANVTTVVTTAAPEKAGGSIYFETDPPGATIWLDSLEIGTGGLTYYSEKTGTFPVRVWKKGYQEYTGTVTVTEGKRVVFEAVLRPVTYEITDTGTPVVTVVTTVTKQKSTITLPTPWPTSPQSPLEPAVVAAAAILGAAIVTIRRR